VLTVVFAVFSVVVGDQDMLLGKDWFDISEACIDAS